MGRAWFDLMSPDPAPPLAIDAEKLNELKAELHTLKAELEALKTFVASIPGSPGVPGHTEKDGKTIILMREQQAATVALIEQAQDDGESFGTELAKALKALKG